MAVPTTGREQGKSVHHSKSTSETGPGEGVMVESHFHDRRGRQVTFVKAASGLIICEGQREIGQFEVEAMAIDPVPGKAGTGYRLTRVFIEEPYRRAGIGSAALACVRNWFEPLLVRRSEHDLAQATPAYRALIARAQRQGQFLHAWPVEVAHRRRRSDLER